MSDPYQPDGWLGLESQMSEPFFRTREHPLFNYSKWKKCVNDDLTDLGYDTFVRRALTAQVDAWEMQFEPNDCPKLCKPAPTIIIEQADQVFHAIKTMLGVERYDFGRGYTPEQLEQDSGWSWHHRDDGSARLELPGGVFTRHAFAFAIHAAPWLKDSGRLFMRTAEMKQPDQYSEDNVLVVEIGGGCVPYISTLEAIKEMEAEA